MRELKKKVNYLKEKKLTGLSFFLTAGYPDMHTFIEIIKELERQDLADFLEVGIPFSDPLADGPVIQYSSRVAIEKGAELNKIFNAVGKMKEKINMPLVLMSYMNPLAAGGNLEKNLNRAREAGFSAIIIPDLPLGESEEIEEAVRKASVGHIFLAAPSTPQPRIKKMSAKSSPFLYYVSSYGVTGGRRKFHATLGSKLEKTKRISPVPVYCGFGISTPAQAASLKKSLDGIIIGSAFINKLKRKNFKAPLKFAININKSLGRI